MTISIVINGAFGKMGRMACEVFDKHENFEVLAKLGRADDLKNELNRLSPDVVLDLTVADAAYDNAQVIIESGARPVIGTSGMTETDVQALQRLAKEKKIAGIVVPNFSIGVVLAMQFSLQAAAYFSDIEIIEKHHQTKKDAPSGTAIRTAELIKAKQQRDVPIHSVRLPGLLAHQDVLFGSEGEVLTIKHDVLSRNCYIQGMILSCEKVMKLDSLAFGLDKIL